MGLLKFCTVAAFYALYGCLVLGQQVSSGKTAMSCTALLLSASLLGRVDFVVPVANLVDVPIAVEGLAVAQEAAAGPAAGASGGGSSRRRRGGTKAAARTGAGGGRGRHGQQQQEEKEGGTQVAAKTGAGGGREGLGGSAAPQDVRCKLASVCVRVSGCQGGSKAGVPVVPTAVLALVQCSWELLNLMQI